MTSGDTLPPSQDQTWLSDAVSEALVLINEGRETPLSADELLREGTPPAPGLEDWMYDPAPRHEQDIIAENHKKNTDVPPAPGSLGVFAAKKSRRY